MTALHTDDFRREAVRIALTCGLTRRQVAPDLGVGLSTLSKWIQRSRPDDIPPAHDIDLAKENDRLRKENRTQFPIHRLCQIMDVTARGYCAWRRRPLSKRQRQDMVLRAHIREQHHFSLKSYGRPRMTQELQDIGLSVGHRRIGRLMRQNNIYAIRTRKYKVTTDSNYTFNIAPNLLNQDFSADKPNQKWAGDISYLWTREGWLYLAVIIDLHSRRVVGWVVSDRLKQDLAMQALNRAIALRNPELGCIHHKDRGSQYCAYDYQKRLRQLKFQVSMSGKGNC